MPFPCFSVSSIYFADISLDGYCGYWHILYSLRDVLINTVRLFVLNTEFAQCLFFSDLKLDGRTKTRKYLLKFSDDKTRLSS